MAGDPHVLVHHVCALDKPDPSCRDPCRHMVPTSTRTKAAPFSGPAWLAGQDRGTGGLGSISIAPSVAIVAFLSIHNFKLNPATPIQSNPRYKNLHGLRLQNPCRISYLGLDCTGVAGFKL